MPDLGSELTDGQKLLARYNLIVQQTKDAQGDATRTADSYANTERRLAAEREDALAKLGKRFKDVAGDAAVVVESTLADITESGGSFVDQLADAFNADITQGIGGFLKSSLLGIHDATDKTAKANKRVKQSYAEVNKEAAERVKRIEQERKAADAAALDKRSFTDLVTSQRSTLDMAERVRDAQREVGETERDVAEQRVTAARRVRDAQKALTEVVRDASGPFGSIAEAQRRLRTSEESLAKAHDRVREAQEALTKARKDASRELEDLQERTDDLARSERQAELRLAQSRTDVGKAKSRREEAQAIEEVAEAEDALADIQRERRRHADDLAEANAKGVEGSDQVRAALQAEKDAQQGVIDANFEVAAAVHNLARVQEDVALRIIDAQLQVAEAIRAAAELDVKNTDRVSDAQRNLRDSFIDAGLEAVAQAERVAEATGRQLTDSERLNIFRGRVEQLGGSLADITHSLFGVHINTADAESKMLTLIQIAANLEETLRRMAGIRVDAGNILLGQPTAPPPGRQHGGPVKRGYPYIVGEKRPELFVPDMNGTIVPRVPTSGGERSVEQHIHVSDELSNYMLVRLKLAAEQGAQRALHQQAWKSVT